MFRRQPGAPAPSKLITDNSAGEEYREELAKKQDDRLSEGQIDYPGIGNRKRDYQWSNSIAAKNKKHSIH